MFEAVIRCLAFASLGLSIIGVPQPQLASVAPGISAVAPAPNVSGSKSGNPVPMTMAQTAQQRMQQLRGGVSPAEGISKRSFLSPRQRIFGPDLQKMRQSQPNARPAAPKAENVSRDQVLSIPGFLGASPFVAAALTPNGPTSAGTVTVDVNNDGLPDLVNIQSNGTLNVLLNPGAGKLDSMTVSFSDSSALNSNTQIFGVVAADINGDGYKDLLALDGNNVDVFLNQKNGTFASVVQYSIPFTGSYYYPALRNGGIAMGDVNGDGVMDMVVLATDPNYPTTFIESLTYLGKGDGTFIAPKSEATSNISGNIYMNCGQLRLADMDKDGKLDLVFLLGGIDESFNYVSFVSVLKGDGTGNFAALPIAAPATGAVVAGVGNGSFGGLEISDIDGDGIPDVLFSLSLDSVYLASGKGDGTLGAANAVITGLANPPVVNFADVNGDGNIDTVAYSTTGQISVYLGQGKGAFSATPLVELASGVADSSQQPAPADFDGDGSVDLVNLDTTLNVVGFYLGGNGSYPGAPVIVRPGDGAPSFTLVASGDINGDGIPDTVSTEYTNATISTPNIVIGLNDGKGHFTYTEAFDGKTLDSGNVANIEPMVVDLNGDGLGDLIFPSYDGVAFAYGQGNGVFSALQDLPLGIACPVNYVDAGDLNGDGATDLVFAYSGDSSCTSGGTISSGYFVLLNKGDGTFVSTFSAYGGSLFEPKLADLNGDGFLDLVVTDNDTNSGTYVIDIIPGIGDGTFNLHSVRETATNTRTSAISLGDFDGDGKQDLAIGVINKFQTDGGQIYGSTGLEVLKGNGDFSFGLPAQYAVGLAPWDIRIGDFNNDGRPDIALNLVPYDDYPNLQSSGFGYLANIGNGTFGPLTQTFTGVSHGGSLTTGDFNNDGALDVLYDGGYGSDLFLNVGAINLTLAASATANEGDPVALTATLAPTVSTATPTGTISLYDNGTLLQSTLISGLSTVANLSDLSVGNHAFTARYSGDSHYNGATASAAVSVAVQPLAPGFTVSGLSPATLSLGQGTTGTATFTLTGNATFSGAVQFSCSGAPAESTCTVSPGNTTFAANQAAIISVVVATTAPNNVSQAKNDAKGFGADGGVALAGLVMLLMPIRRRLPKAFLVLLVAALALAGAGVLTGCGDSGNSKPQYPGTAAGNSTLTITATSGRISQTQTLALTITQPTSAK
jgi:Bacterial Ig-like domain (group 3)/FG-GAP-like repeat